MIDFSDSQWQEFRENPYQNALIYLTAKWCSPCRAFAPILSQVEKELETLTILKVDVDENRWLAKHLGVMSVPTLILFVNGVPSARIVGVQNKNALVVRLRENMDIRQNMVSA